MNRSTVHSGAELARLACHELRTPTLIIMESGRLLRDAPPGDPGRRQELAEMIVRQAEALQRVAETLATLAREGPDQDADGTDVGSVLRRVRAELEDVPGGGEIAVAVALEGEARVRMRSQVLHVVLANVLGNAAKYAAAGAVDVGVVAGPDRATVTVRNRSRPIPEHVQPRLFEPFVRYGPVPAAGGDGLGLYLVRRLVEAHGGSVDLAATAEDPSTVTCTVVLPAAG